MAVYKSLGSRQCEGGGPEPSALAEPLRQAGVPVLATACGQDGRMRAAMCGLSDGRIAVFDIPADRLEDAQKLGYGPLSALPDATRAACR
ncbi:MAG TPA: hypothetical protein VNO84_18305 [Burkholderiaceae bacterium]|nr:hypothetical protein [Burkholderiaceae bacterium]